MKRLLQETSRSILQTWLSLSDWRMYLRSVNRLRSYHNRYKGQRCFIIGNGPSLREMNLALLKHEYTFGLNRIYLLFPRLGFHTTFLVSVNRYVVEQFGKEIIATPSVKIISWFVRQAMPPRDDTIYIRPGRKERFSRNPLLTGIWEGTSVTYVAMQLAFYMGFSTVILIGVDHTFKSTGPPHTVLVSQSDDQDHFDPHYFGKGIRWQLPDLQTSETAYRMAKAAFEADGREILDATIGGKLSVFRKIDYLSLFHTSSSGV